MDCCRGRVPVGVNFEDNINDPLQRKVISDG
jgi:hypothetical protein